MKLVLISTVAAIGIGLAFTSFTAPSTASAQFALSFSVTYWDYLGWKDKFGKKDFTKRQKNYARYINVGNLYTPQIVLNGKQHNSGFTRKEIEQTRLPDTRPLIDVETDNETLKIVEDANINLENYDLKLVAYQPGMQTTPVNRGENRNRKLQNYNVVSDIYELSKSNQYSMSIKSHDDSLAYVLFASDPADASVISVTHIGAN